jgi:hypothetical protein
MHKSNVLFCLLLVTSQCARGADSPQENHVTQKEITKNPGRWARLRKAVHETEQQSPLLFNAVATVCEGCGALGSVALVVDGIRNIVIKQDLGATIEIVFSPTSYFVIKYLVAKPLRITGGLCVQTKNWIFGSPKKADNDATQQ